MPINSLLNSADVLQSNAETPHPSQPEGFFSRTIRSISATAKKAVNHVAPAFFIGSIAAMGLANTACGPASGDPANPSISNDAGIQGNGGAGGQGGAGGGDPGGMDGGSEIPNNLIYGKSLRTPNQAQSHDLKIIKVKVVQTPVGKRGIGMSGIFGLTVIDPATMKAENLDMAHPYDPANTNNPNNFIPATDVLDMGSNLLLVADDGSEPISPQMDIGRLSVVDISDPKNPKVIGTPLQLGSQQKPSGMEKIDENTFAVAQGTGGISIIKWDGTNLSEAYQITDTTDDNGQPVALDAKDFVLLGDRLYVGGQNLHIFDASDPDNVVWLKTMPLPGTITGVKLDGGGNLVVSRYANGAQIYDLSDKDNPALLAEIKDHIPLVESSSVDDMTFFAMLNKGFVGYKIDDYKTPYYYGIPKQDKSVALDPYTFSIEAYKDDSNTNRLLVGAWYGADDFKPLATNSIDQIPPAPDAPFSYTFGKVPAGQTLDGHFQVGPFGPTPIAYKKAVSPLGPFKFLSAQIAGSEVQFPFTLSPGQKAQMNFQFVPTDDNKAANRLLFGTDAPNFGTYPVEASGNLNGVNVGDPFPDYTLTDIHGQDFSIGQLIAGKPTVADFFSPYCAACKVEGEFLNVLAQNNNINVIAIASNPWGTPPTVQSLITFAQQAHLNSQNVYIAPDNQNIYTTVNPEYANEIPYPVIFFVDMDGSVKCKFTSADPALVNACSQQAS